MVWAVGLVEKIHYSFMICLLGFTNHYFIWRHMQQFLLQYVLMMQTNPLPHNLNNCFLGHEDQFHPIFSQLACILCIFSYCVQWNLLFKIFFNFSMNLWRYLALHMFCIQHTHCRESHNVAMEFSTATENWLHGKRRITISTQQNVFQ